MTTLDPLEFLRDVWSLGTAPASLGNGLTYARGMHNRPLEYFVDRIATLGIKGKRVLDAGCGTGTWSFALRTAFDEVVGLDYTEERVRVAQWLAEHGRVPGMTFRTASILDTGLPDQSVDAVFCYSVLISSLSAKDTLKEFHRILKPGGVAYVSLNGIGWSYYLRDERGAQDPKFADMGRQGIYNTMVRSLPDHEITAIYSRAIAPLGDGATRLTDRLFAAWPKAVRLMARVKKKVRKTRPALSASNVSRARAELDDWINYLSPRGMPPCRLEQVVETIATECGDPYLVELAGDISRLARSEPNFLFSHTHAGHGYAPDEMQAICESAGLVDFQWAPEGMIIGSAKSDPTKPIHDGYVGPNLKVWDFLAFKPSDTLAAEAEPEWFRTNTRIAAALPYLAPARTPMLTNVDARTVPRGWVEEAGRRAKAAGGERLIASLAAKLCEGAEDDEQRLSRLIEFTQDVLVHHPIVQPFQFNGAAVTDPATLLFLGIGRCGAAAPLLASLCRGIGIDARIEQLAGHVVALANLAGEDVLLEGDVFKKGVIPREPDGRILRYRTILENPEVADGLPDFSTWQVRYHRDATDIWGRRPYGYVDADGAMRIYSSYFGQGARHRFRPRVPVLSAERAGSALHLSWDDATPVDGAAVDYRVVGRKTPRGWGYDTEPSLITPILSPPPADFEQRVEGTTKLEIDWPQAGYLEVTPRLKDRPDVFCWPSDEVRVDAAKS